MFSTNGKRLGIYGQLHELGHPQNGKAVSFYPVVLDADRKGFRYEDDWYALGKETA
jgi:hypothetical protein